MSILVLDIHWDVSKQLKRVYVLFQCHFSTTNHLMLLLCNFSEPVWSSILPTESRESKPERSHHGRRRGGTELVAMADLT